MEYAIYLRQGSVSNVITDNTARNNVWGGIFINSHSNTAINNVLINGQHRGLYMVNCHNNTITGGSIYNNTDSDYEVSIEATDNNVTNTNFTDSRKIHFWDTTSWFDYRNDTSQNIWIKTNISSEATITRKLINWSNALMQWNDTFSNTSGSIIARYNVTGLSTSVNYNVYNNSALTYTINSGTNGEISFTIYLPANQERNITVQKV
jgi:parallel beta-helix repeat protein